MSSLLKNLNINPLKNILIDTTTFPIWTPPIEDSNESLIQIIENEFTFSNSLSGYFSSELNPLRGISDNFRDRRSISFSKEIVFDDAYILNSTQI